MAKTLPDAGASRAPEVEINLKDPWLAAFLAWLVPGLGHLYQGRTGKGILFFVCIVGTFVYGMYIGGCRVVYASTKPISMQFLQDRWQYVCQFGAGLPALPALVERYRAREDRKLELDGKEPKMGPLFGGHVYRPPREATPFGEGFKSPDRSDPDPKRMVQHPDELAKWNYDLGDYFEIGTVFTVIAGLLNILAIYDAYGGPLMIAPAEEKKKPEAAKA
jgi:hypothetical protein